jgi:DegV family protein with EDD domain
MQIVTDGAMDLSPEQLHGLNIHNVPVSFTLDNRTYRSGIDIQPADFYCLLEASGGFPTTSQPSPGDFADLYRKLAQSDADILSIHVSSGLSGTLNAARLGAEMVSEARVTFFDTKTLSGAQGWHVEAAARAVTAGWELPRILALLEQIGAATDTMFTVATLKYLIHGGRISHLRGLLGSLLDIKPIISVEKVGGTYVQQAAGRSLRKMIPMLADLIARQHAPGTGLRIQVLHADNDEGACLLRETLNRRFDCTWLPTGPIAPVLGAHTGPGLVGVVYAPQAAFAGLA